MNFRLAFISFIGVILVSGCSSIFMPYKDEFRCNKGIGEGSCASMSENYKTIQESKGSKSSTNASNDTDKDKKELTSADRERLERVGSACKKCEDTSEAIWLKQRALEKELELSKRGQQQ